MRTLSEITTAVRSLEPFTTAELQYAVVAYDVLMARLELSNDPKQLQKYFEAAEADVVAYVGEDNDPLNPAAREWYKAMIAVPDAVADLVEAACKPGDNLDEKA